MLCSHVGGLWRSSASISLPSRFSATSPSALSLGTYVSHRTDKGADSICDSNGYLNVNGLQYPSRPYVAGGDAVNRHSTYAVAQVN
jgi:hypothetical protein